jgi:ubiquitin-protein ligase
MKQPLFYFLFLLWVFPSGTYMLPDIKSHNFPTSQQQHSQNNSNLTSPAADYVGNKTAALKKSKVNEKAKASGRKVSSTTSQEAATLRRIKCEWKDAVRLGIAYDWANMKTVGAGSENYNYVRLGPFGNNLLRWHFSVEGPPKSEFDGGIFHGRILLPKNYPGSPPRVQLLTPSGRFIPGHDICLSASSYHPETWTPKWTILSLVDALRLHMITQANEIGGVSASPEERRRLAQASRTWKAGKISHEMMIRQGIFKSTALDSVSRTDHARGLSGDTELFPSHLSQTGDHVQLAEKIPRRVNLMAFVVRDFIELLHSPLRLTALLIVALFLILNR